MSEYTPTLAIGDHVYAKRWHPATSWRDEFTEPVRFTVARIVDGYYQMDMDIDGVKRGKHTMWIEKFDKYLVEHPEVLRPPDIPAIR